MRTDRFLLGELQLAQCAVADLMVRDIPARVVQEPHALMCREYTFAGLRNNEVNYWFGKCLIGRVDGVARAFAQPIVRATHCGSNMRCFRTQIPSWHQLRA